MLVSAKLARWGIGLELELVDDFIQIRLYFVTQLELKEKEKIDKYQDLARELTKETLQAVSKVCAID